MGNEVSEPEAKNVPANSCKRKPSKKFKGPPTLMCHFCGLQFGTRGLGFHIKKCKEQFIRQQEAIPKKHRKQSLSGPNTPTPKIEDGPDAFERYNEEAYELLKAGAMHTCEGCGRSFMEYDKFRKHQKRCEDFLSGHRIPTDTPNRSTQAHFTVHLWPEHAAPHARVQCDSDLGALKDALMQALGADSLRCPDMNEAMGSMSVSQFMTTVSSEGGVSVSATGCQPPEHVHVLVAGSAKATPGVKSPAKKGDKLSVKARQALGDVSTIVEGFLFLSGQLGATSKAVVERMGITHILNLCSRVKCVFKKSKRVIYKVIDIFDTKRSDIRKHFPAANAFLRSAAEAGGRVLVHCLVGASRSATICLAYLMCERDMSLRDAYRLVRTERVMAKPNLGFRSQLIEYEAELRGSTTMDAEGFDKMANDISEGRSTDGDYNSSAAQTNASKRRTATKSKATKSSARPDAPRSNNTKQPRPRPASAGIQLHATQRILVAGFAGCGNSQLATQTCASYVSMHRNASPSASVSPLEVQTRMFETEDLYREWLKSVPLRRLGIARDGTAHSIHGFASPFIWRSRGGTATEREGAATYRPMAVTGAKGDAKDAPFTLGAYRYIGGAEALLAFLMSWKRQYKKASKSSSARPENGGQKKSRGHAPETHAKACVLENSSSSPRRANVKSLLRLSRDSAAAQLLQKRRLHARRRKTQQQRSTNSPPALPEEADAEMSSVSEDVPVSDETDELSKSDVEEQIEMSVGSS